MASHALTQAERMCVHNAGGGQKALGWFTCLAGDRAIAWSGGSEPVAGINPGVIVPSHGPMSSP